MILYISSATAYPIYDRLAAEGSIKAGYTAQKFNNNLIRGLGSLTDITSLSNLPYDNTDAERIEESIGSAKYICIRNRTGKLHYLYNVYYMLSEGQKIVDRYKPQCIICDAIAFCPSVAAHVLSKKNNIPAFAIITDVPEYMCTGKAGFFDRRNAAIMKGFDGYILLTQQMNEVVNPKHRPYMIMEGCCSDILPDLKQKSGNKRIALYSGALWKEAAGLEYFIKGFLDACLENWELHFYGSGDLAPYLSELAEKNSRIKFFGVVPNNVVVEKQSEADLLINPRPSGSEFCKYSFPSKTFEYMASGTPVLMTVLPGIGSEYYKYVYSIKEESPSGVSAAMREIASKSDSELKEKGLKARDYIYNNKNCITQSRRILDFITENFGVGL